MKTQITNTKHTMIERCELRTAITLLAAYRQEMYEQMAMASHSNQDRLAKRVVDIKETLTYLNQVLAS